MSHLQLDEYGRLPFDSFKVRLAPLAFITKRAYGKASWQIGDSIFVVLRTRMNLSYAVIASIRQLMTPSTRSPQPSARA